MPNYIFNYKTSKILLFVPISCYVTFPHKICQICLTLISSYSVFCGVSMIKKENEN